MHGISAMACDAQPGRDVEPELQGRDAIKNLRAQRAADNFKNRQSVNCE
jgi:hypothetical protein